jgi:hypothetical protein
MVQDRPRTSIDFDDRDGLDVATPGLGEDLVGPRTADGWAARKSRGSGEASRYWKIVEEHVNRTDPTFSGDDKIGSSVSRRFARSAGNPSDPAGITRFLGRGDGLISEIWMGCSNHSGDAMDLVPSANRTAIRVMEDCIFEIQLFDGSSTTDGVGFAKHVT